MIIKTNVAVYSFNVFLFVVNMQHISAIISKNTGVDLLVVTGHDIVMFALANASIATLFVSLQCLVRLL